jgi:hypothetical protein
VVDVKVHGHVSEETNGGTTEFDGARPPRPSSDLNTIAAYLNAGRPPLEDERLRQLQDLGVDPYTCSPGASRLLLGREPPIPATIRLVVRDLRTDGQDADRIRAVLEICDVRIERAQLEQLIASIDRERERLARPGENFGITRVERVEHADAPSFILVIERDDRPGEQFEVEVRWSDLESCWRFQGRLVRQIGFMPLLKPHFMGDKFARFAALVINGTTLPAHAPEHGRLHGRPAQTAETNELLLDVLTAQLAARDGFWQEPPSEVYRVLSAEARARGPIPLDWPETVVALGRRLAHTIGWDGLVERGIDWRRDRENGGHRPWRYTFRLRTESASTRPGTAA